MRTYQFLGPALCVFLNDLLGEPLDVLFYGIHFDILIVYVLLQCPCCGVKCTVLDDRFCRRPAPSQRLRSHHSTYEKTHVSSTASPALRFRNAIRRALRASEASCSDMVGGDVRVSESVFAVSRERGSAARRRGHMTTSPPVLEIHRRRPPTSTAESGFGGMLEPWRSACLRVISRHSTPARPATRRFSTNVVVRYAAARGAAGPTVNMEDFPCELIR